MAAERDLKGEIEKEISTHKIVVYSKSYCSFCDTAKSILTKYNAPDVFIKELDLEMIIGNDIQDILTEMTKQNTVPNIFISGKHLGGCDTLQKLEKSGELQVLLSKL